MSEQVFLHARARLTVLSERIVLSQSMPNYVQSWPSMPKSDWHQTIDYVENHRHYVFKL
jgi:hypothetical protein